MIIRKLPEICEIKTGKRDANHANPSGKYRFYTCASQYSMCDTFSFSGESIIVPGNGDIGLVFYYNGAFEAYQRTYVLSNIKICPKYLYYHLVYKWRHINSDKQYGSTVRYVRMSNFTSYELPVPSLDEQERIVARIEELFSELDNGVETLRKTKQQLAVYRKAVLKHAFAPKEDWRKATVADIGEVNLGRQRSPKHVSNDYPTKYIRAANITENGLALDDVLEMEFSPEERKKYYLHNGDIVISEASGSASQVGKPAIWRGEIPNCCFQNTVIRHRVISEHPEYVFWYYKYLYVCGYFSKIVGGVGINHLGAKNFASIEVDLAPVEKQLQVVTQIETRLSLCDSIEKTVDTALQQAEAMRQSILKHAFEGKL